MLKSFRSQMFSVSQISVANSDQPWCSPLVYLRGGLTCVHESLQVLVYLAWMLVIMCDRNDINALNL